MKSKTPWVVTNFNRGLLGECLRCGRVLGMDLPQHVDVVVAAMRAFVKVHEHCEEKGEL
jgi:hypothetical protein